MPDNECTCTGCGHTAPQAGGPHLSSEGDRPQIATKPMGEEPSQRRLCVSPIISAV